MAVADGLEWVTFNISSKKNLQIDGVGFKYLESSTSGRFIRTDKYVTFNFKDILDTFPIETREGNITRDFSIDSYRANNRTHIILSFNMSGLGLSSGDALYLDPTVKITNVGAYASLNKNVTTKGRPISHITMNDSLLHLYYNFDTDINVTGGTITDLSRHNMEGTLGTAPATANATIVEGGYIGQGLRTDGNRDFVDVTDFQQLEGINSFSVSFWMKADTNAPTIGTQQMMEKIGGGNDLLIFSWTTGQDIRFRVDDTTGSTISGVFTNGVTDQGWHHLVGVMNQSHVTVYVDTVRGGQFSAWPGGTTQVDVANNLVIGGTDNGVNAAFNGTMDEVMIWVNKSLTPEEIDDIFNNRTHRFKTPATQTFASTRTAQNGSFDRLNVSTNSTQLYGTGLQLRVGSVHGLDNYSSASLPFAPEFWYRMDNTTGENRELMLDFGTRGMNITCSDASDECPNSTTSSGGYFGVKHSNNNNLWQGVDDDIIGNMTVTVWINFTSTDGANNNIIEKTSNTIQNGEWELSISPAFFRLEFNCGSTTSSADINDFIRFHQWHFLAMRFNADTNEGAFFLDGNRTSTFTNSDTCLNPDSEPIIIAEGIEGEIDNLIVFERFLTDEEIFQVAAFGGFNYTFSPWQNVSDGDNNINQFNITDTTNYTVLEFDFISSNGTGGAPTTKFYSPYLKDNIIMESFTGPAGAPAPIETTINVSLAIDIIASVDKDVTADRDLDQSITLVGLIARTKEAVKDIAERFTALAFVDRVKKVTINLREFISINSAIKRAFAGFRNIFLSILINVFASTTKIADINLNPLINFTRPTLPNATITANKSVQINVSIIERNLTDVNFNWNGTDTIIFNESTLLFWNLDNRSSLDENDTHIFDLSKYGNNGSTAGSVVVNVTGKYNGAFTFSGADEITAGDLSITENLTSMSLAIWMRARTNHRGVLMAKAGSSGATSSYLLSTRNNDPEQLNLFLTNDTNTPEHFINVTYSDGLWHFVVASWNGSHMTLYWDGVEFKENANTGDFSNFSGKIKETGAEYVIGNHPTNGGQSFQGELDEPMIFNRSLSTQEVEQLYFSNLYKFNNSNWVLFVNQSKNATATLVIGNYTYGSTARNSEGRTNSTEFRTVEITDVLGVTVIDITQLLNLFGITDRKFTGVREVFQRIDINVGVDTRLRQIRNVFQRIDLFTFVQRQMDATRNIFQRLLFFDRTVSTKVGINAVDVTQPLNIFAFIEKTKTITTNIAQRINIFAFIERSVDATRNIFQRLLFFDRVDTTKVGINAVDVTAPINIFTIIQRTADATRDVTQRINIFAFIERQREVTRNLAEKIDIFTFVQRQMDATRNIFQRIIFFGITARDKVGVNDVDITQQINIFTIAQRSADATRDVVDRILINTFIQNTLEKFALVTQRIDIFTIVERTVDATRNIIQRILFFGITNVNKVGVNVIDITQPINVFAFVERTMDAARDLTQRINIFGFTDTQRLTPRNIAERILINDATDKLFLGFRDITQRLRIFVIVDKFSGKATDIAQSFTITAIIDKTKTITTNIAQAININSAIDRVASFFRDLVQRILFFLSTVGPIDVTAPNITIIFPENNSLHEGGFIDFIINTSETISSYRYSFDGGVTNQTPPVSNGTFLRVVFQNTSTYDVTVYGFDGSNNVGSDIVTVSFIKKLTQNFIFYIFLFILAITMLMFGYIKDHSLLITTAGVFFIVIGLGFGTGSILDISDNFVNRGMAFVIAGVGAYLIVAEPLDQYLRREKE